MITLESPQHVSVTTRLHRPLFGCKVPAGFPSPADDYIDRSLDLNEHLIEHPAATFFIRVVGDSMTGAGIHSDDILIVDRAVEPKDGSVVVAVIDGELTVKRLRKRDGVVSLVPANEDYPTLFPSADSDFTIWGVVMHSIHKV